MDAVFPTPREVNDRAGTPYDYRQQDSQMPHRVIQPEGSRTHDEPLQHLAPSGCLDLENRKPDNPSVRSASNTASSSSMPIRIDLQRSEHG